MPEFELITAKPKGPRPRSILESLRQHFEGEFARLEPEGRKALDRALEHCAEALEFLCPAVKIGATLARGPWLGKPLSRDRQLFFFVTDSGRILDFAADWRRIVVPPLPDNLRSAPGALRRAAIWKCMYKAIEDQDPQQAVFLLTMMAGEGRTVMLERIEELRQEGLTPGVLSLVGRSDGGYVGISGILRLPTPVDLVIQEAEGNG